MESRKSNTPLTVVITGVAGQWGSRLARRLLADPTLHVLGIDRREPTGLPARLDFVRADVRDPLLAELLQAEQVDVVVHLAWRERQWPREEERNSNILGTLALLGACVEAGVRQVVLKSTLAVYGARPDTPLYLSEDWPLRPRSACAWLGDMLEVEHFLAEFAGQHPELKLTVLRLANIVGWEVDTPFSRLLRLPMLPVPLGFDPLLQVIDAEDVIEVLAWAATRGIGGTFNVAAAGIVSLCQVARIMGRPILPLLPCLAGRGWQLTVGLLPGRRWLSWLAMEPDFLCYPCTGDLSRMQHQLRFQPRYEARAIIRRFAEQARIARYAPAVDQDAAEDERLRQIIAQRRQAREATSDV